MVNFNILATLTFSRCSLDEVCQLVSYHKMSPRRNQNVSTIRKNSTASLSVCAVTTLIAQDFEDLSIKTKSTVESGQIIFIV